MENFKTYKEDRKAFVEKWKGREMFDYIDQWPLYAGTRNISRFLAISDILRDVLDIPGDIAEFGSWRGSNIVFMAKLLETLVPNSPKSLHCFEGFQGLTTFVEQDGDATKFKGEYKGDYEELKDVIALHNLESRIQIHKGLIQDTVPEFMKTDDWRRYSFLYFDCDLYDPAMIMMNNFWDRLTVGGVMVFDEWNDYRYPGEANAVTDFFKDRTDYEMSSPSFTLQPNLVIKKTFPKNG